MNCPYCLSEVSEQAYVCKTCSRDLYLFKPLMAKVADLEEKLATVSSPELYELRIAELEHLLDEQNHRLEERSSLQWVFDIALYLITPLLLLLLAHWLIAVVYDTKMLYLRIISMVLPLPFPLVAAGPWARRKMARTRATSSRGLKGVGQQRFRRFRIEWHQHQFQRHADHDVFKGHVGQTSLDNGFARQFDIAHCPGCERFRPGIGRRFWSIALDRE